jgi:tetratricopeptide (TPR) repeat protein
MNKTWRVPLSRALSLLALWLFLLCGSGFASRPDQAANLPELPRIVPDDFPPATVRDKVRVAYAAVLADPLDASANGKLAMVLEAYRPDDERAEACYRRAHQLDPGSFRWTYYMSMVLAARAKYDQAIATLRQALQLDSEYLPAELKMGEYLATVGRSDDARKVYENIVRQHPESAQAYYALGRAYETTRNLPKAVDAFRKACELFPYFGAAHYALARAYQRLGKGDAAREELARFEEYKYDIPGVGDRLQADLDELYMDPQSLLGLAIELGNRGRWEEAIAKHELLLQFEPGLLRAHINLISLYGHLHEYEKAEEHYVAAVRLDPTQGESHYNYGVLLMQQNKNREAEEAFRKALATNSRYAEAHNNLGDLLQREGKLAQAMAEFEKAIENKPDFPQAHFNLGRLLVNQGRYKEALDELLKTLGTHDDESKPTYLYAVGAAYARAGDRDNGIRYMRLARELAASRHQSALLNSIDRDVRMLEENGTVRP